MYFGNNYVYAIAICCALLCGCSESPLAQAVKQQDSARVEQLLRAGNSPNQKTRSGETLLNLSIRTENRELFRLLLEHGADPNLIGEIGSSSVHWAAEMTETDWLEGVLAIGGDVDRENTGNRFLPGMTPIFYAVNNRRDKCVDYLIDSGADLNHQEKRGFTPLIWAVECMMYRQAVLMLEMGADPTIKTKAGSSLFDLGVLKSDFEVPFLDRESSEALQKLRDYVNQHRKRE